MVFNRFPTRFPLTALYFFSFLLTPAAQSSTGLTITELSSNNAMISSLFADGNCLAISNVQSYGNRAAFGRFANGQSTVGLSDGLVLATCNVAMLPAQNSTQWSLTGFSQNSEDDPDLATLTSLNQNNLASLEFDLLATAPTLTFEFVFGSDEYCEFITWPYTDAMGIFVNGQNVALVPGPPDTLVSPKTVNSLYNSQYFVPNSPSCGVNNPPAFYLTQLDGWTTVLTATVALVPNSVNHIKIAIADIGDFGAASAVFVRASAGGSEKLLLSAYPNIYEACYEGKITLTRPVSTIDSPLTVNLAIGGTATPGVDYSTLPSTVVIPAGQLDAVLLAKPFADFVPEGDETILVTVPNGCPTASSATIVLKDTDYVPLEVTLSDTSACAGSTIVLQPVLTGGNGFYQFQWQNNTNQPQLSVSQPGTYRVTVSGVCGMHDTAVAHVSFYPAGAMDTTIQFCQGDAIALFGQTYTTSTSFTYAAPGQNGQCDTTLEVTLLAVPQLIDTVTMALCPYESVVFNGQTYVAPATVDILHAGLAGACDTFVTYRLLLLPQVVLADTLTLCPGDTVVLGGQAYGGPGTVVVTLPGSAGQCDTVHTYVLLSALANPPTVQLACPPPVEVEVAIGETSAVVTYPAPAGMTDCVCPDLTIAQSTGFPSGAIFPLGTTLSCFEALDACGATATCCVSVTVLEKPPCDVKTNGCIEWQLLDVAVQGDGSRRYRIRVTNNCPQRVVNAIFQLPDGLVASSPTNSSIYTAPGSGRKYWVNNPNFSTFYSIRFNAAQPGMATGQSDLFEYVLPPAAQMQFILAQVRVAPSTFYAAHLNTFDCDAPQLQARGSSGEPSGAGLFPNPARDVLFIDVDEAGELPLRVRIFDLRGACVLQAELPAGAGPHALELPAGLPGGVYVVEVRRADGWTETLRLMVER
jgi:hypothetical protein